MKKKNEKKSLLDSRKVSIPLSVLIAIGIWTIVTLYIVPKTSVTINNVPVNFTYDTQYQQLSLDIVNAPEARASVQLDGNGADIVGLGSADMIVYPDYSAVKGPGTVELPLKVQLTNSQLAKTVTAVTDAKVTVVFDTVVEKEFTVQVELNEVTTAEGYVLHSRTATPRSVTVRGPESEVEKIGGIVAPVEYSEELQNLSDSKLATVTLQARDANNQPVDLQYTTFDNTMADVNISVYQTKELPLAVNFINVPANYDLSNLKYSLSQQTMMVTGKPATIAGLTELAVSDFDLAGSFELDKSYQLSVNLPKDVESRDNLSTVTLTFNTEGLATKTLNVSNIRVVNQPTNIQIKPTVTRLNNVTLVGPREQLEKLSPASVVAMIDAGDIQVTEGTESLAVSIQVPSSSTIFAIGSYSVECTIAASGAAG